MEVKHWELIAKNLSGNASDLEKQQLSEWINQHPENEQRYLQAKELWNTVPKSEDREVDIADRWEIMKSKLLENNDDFKVISLQTLKFNWLYVAASLVVIMLGGLFLFLDRPQHIPNNFDNEISSNNIEIFYLPDSSLVYLNKNSTFKYNNDFTSERTVYLEGEAYFEVKRDESKPFVIHTSTSLTKVLGTSFNLKAYKAQPTTELIVNSGKVSFSSGQNQPGVLLEKGEKGIVTNDSKEVKEEINNDLSYLSWKTNKEELSKSKAYQQELTSNPTTYLYTRFHWKENLIKQTVIEGKISNAAIFTCYDHITLKAIYLGTDQKVIGEEQFVINKKLNPGDEIVYKHKLKNWLKATKEVIVDVIDAKVIKE